MNSEPAHLRLYRSILAGAGIAYLGWWFVVEMLLPGAFNPFGSRAAVVACFAVIFAGTYFSRWLREHVDLGFAVCAWITTLHYFYLFYKNQSDINWIVGSYILAIAVCACIQTAGLLLAYCTFVMFLSAGMVYLNQFLLRSIFLPGMLTILFFAYLGLRARLRLLTRLAESYGRLQSIFDATFEGIVVHANGVILDVNESLAKLFGYERSEMIGRSVLDFAAPESRALITEMIRGENETPYRFTGLRSDGTTLSLEARGKRHYFDDQIVRLTAVREPPAAR